MDKLLELLFTIGYPTFVLDLVSTYIHELLHASLLENSEQETHDLELELVEEFLEITLPENLGTLTHQIITREAKLSKTLI